MMSRRTRRHIACAFSVCLEEASARILFIDWATNHTSDPVRADHLSARPSTPHRTAHRSSKLSPRQFGVRRTRRPTVELSQITCSIQLPLICRVTACRWFQALIVAIEITSAASWSYQVGRGRAWSISRDTGQSAQKATS